MLEKSREDNDLFHFLLGKKKEFKQKRTAIQLREQNLVRFFILSFAVNGLVFFHHLKNLVFGIPPNSRSDFISHAQEDPEEGSKTTGLLFIQVLTIISGEVFILYYIQQARIA